jgi:hypothetical protein
VSGAVTDWQGIHMDWAGPWPLTGGHTNLRNWTQRLAIDLFFDFHGEKVEARTFFVAVRRFFAAQEGVPLDEAYPESSTRVGTDWANGEIVNADPETTLIMRDSEADQLVFALHTMASTATHHDIRGEHQQVDYHYVPAPAAAYGWVGLDVIAAIDAPDLLGDDIRDDGHAYADGSPIPAPYQMWLRMWFSDHTQSQSWTFTLTEAMSFGTALEMVLSQRRSYLDAAGEQGLAVFAEYPDGPADTGVSGEPADWNHLDRQAASIAEDALMRGATHVVVSAAGYPLADLTLDDLVDEDQDAWYQAYGE